MKLRLLGNSVRMRMSQSEVEKLATSGFVQDSVEFSPTPLVYILHSSKESTHLEISFQNGWITITVPEEQIRKWASGSAVGIEGAFGGVSVLIEKDWPCLHVDDADNKDTFPRPTA
jgi:hypothetical protein